MIILDQETIATIRRVYETGGWDAAADELQRRWPGLASDIALEVIDRVLAQPIGGQRQSAPRRRRVSAPYAMAP